MCVLYFNLSIGRGRQRTYSRHYGAISHQILMSLGHTWLMTVHFSYHSLCHLLDSIHQFHVCGYETNAIVCDEAFPNMTMVKEMSGAPRKAYWSVWPVIVASTFYKHTLLLQCCCWFRCCEVILLTLHWQMFYYLPQSLSNLSPPPLSCLIMMLLIVVTIHLLSWRIWYPLYSNQGPLKEVEQGYWCIYGWTVLYRREVVTYQSWSVFKSS